MARELTAFRVVLAGVSSSKHSRANLRLLLGGLLYVLPIPPLQASCCVAGVVLGAGVVLCGRRRTGARAPVRSTTSSTSYVLQSTSYVLQCEFLLIVLVRSTRTRTGARRRSTGARRRSTRLLIVLEHVLQYDACHTARRLPQARRLPRSTTPARVEWGGRTKDLQAANANSLENVSNLKHPRGPRGMP